LSFSGTETHFGVSYPNNPDSAIALTRGHRQRTIPLVNRAARPISIKLNNTAGIRPNRDPNKRRIRLPIPTPQRVVTRVFHLATARVAPEISQAPELEPGIPAVALDGELAAVARVVAGGMVGRVGLGVDGLAVCCVCSCVHVRSGGQKG
jgi:hypothetical protein